MFVALLNRVLHSHVSRACRSRLHEKTDCRDRRPIRRGQGHGGARDCRPSLVIVMSTAERCIAPSVGRRCGNTFRLDDEEAVTHLAERTRVSTSPGPHVVIDGIDVTGGDPDASD